MTPGVGGKSIGRTESRLEPVNVRTFCIGEAIVRIAVEALDRIEIRVAAPEHLYGPPDRIAAIQHR